MPIAEIFTTAKIIEACFCGIIGNRVDAGAISAGMQLVRLFGGGLPQNHHVLKAMHDAFVQSLGIMALACDSVGGSASDHYARRALKRFARSEELKTLRLDAANIPFDALDARVRAIYGQQGAHPKQAATDSVIALVETAMREPLTEPLREVFRAGHGRYAGWADTFELYFAADVKANTALFRILTLDRQNELVSLANTNRDLIDRLSDDISEFRAEVRANHNEVMAALGRLEAANKGGEVAPHEAIDIVARAVREGHLTDDQRARLAAIYADFLDATTEIPPALIAAAKKQLAEADDPDLLDAALRNLAGERRKALIAETEARVDDAVKSAAARYRRLASFAALESLADGVRLYRKALALEQDDFWSWIELSRLYEFMGVLHEQRRCAEQALQHATGDRDRGVANSELGDATIHAGDLEEAQRRFETYNVIAERLAAQEPGNAEWQRDLSVSHDKLGDVAVAAGDLGEARRRFEAGLAIAERLAAQEPRNAGWQRDLSVSHSKLGDVAVAAGDLGEARWRFAAGLVITERLAAQEPGNAEWQRDLSVSYDRLGDVAVAAGDLGEAQRRFMAGLAIRERLAAQEPGNAEWQRDLSVSHNKLGDVAVAAGDLGEARRRFVAGLAIAERLAAQEPRNAGWQRDLSISHERLGDVAAAAGDLGEAGRRHEARLAIAERLAAQEPGNAGWQRDLSVSHDRLGDVAVAAGDLGEARRRFEAGLAIAERLAGQEPGNAGWQRDLFVSHNRLGRVALAAGDNAAAALAWRTGEAIVARLVALRPDHPGYARDLETIRAILTKIEPPVG